MIKLSKIIEDWSEQKVMEYLKNVKRRCDESPKFEKNFFNNHFEDLVNSEKLALEDIMEIFECSFEFVDPTCEKGCDEDIAPDGLKPGDLDPGDRENLDEDVPAQYFSTDTHILATSVYPEHTKLNVVANATSDMSAKVSWAERNLTVTCSNPDPFLKKYVTHVMYIPENYDIETVSATLYQGMLNISADEIDQNEDWEIDIVNREDYL